jgi:hypothetical protein
MNEKNFVSKSKLAKPIQDIIHMIFDIEKILQQMKEFEVAYYHILLIKYSKEKVSHNLSFFSKD